MRGNVKHKKVVSSGRLTGGGRGQPIRRRLNTAQCTKTMMSANPEYSLYSTDSEEQVAILHKGLDGCTALLDGILKAEREEVKSRPEHSVSVKAKPVSSSVKAREAAGKKTCNKPPKRTGPPPVHKRILSSQSGLVSSSQSGPVSSSHSGPVSSSHSGPVSSSHSSPVSSSQSGPVSSSHSSPVSSSQSGPGVSASGQSPPTADPGPALTANQGCKRPELQSTATSQSGPEVPFNHRLMSSTPTLSPEELPGALSFPPAIAVDPPPHGQPAQGPPSVAGLHTADQLAHSQTSMAVAGAHGEATVPGPWPGGVHGGPPSPSQEQEEESAPLRDVQAEIVLQLQPLRSQNALLRRRVRILNQQLQERERAERESRDNQCVADACTLQAELSHAHARLQEVEGQGEELRRALRDTQSEGEELRREGEELRRRLRDAEATNTRLQTELDISRSRLLELQRQNSELTQHRAETMHAVHVPNSVSLSPSVTRPPLLTRRALDQHDRSQAPAAAPSQPRLHANVSQYLSSLGGGGGGGGGRGGHQEDKENQTDRVMMPLPHSGENVVRLAPTGRGLCADSSPSSSDWSLCQEEEEHTAGWSSVCSGTTFNTRDEERFQSGLAALDASIASLQRTLRMDLQGKHC